MVQLREYGEAFFNAPEAAFDLLYPGQYFRRLKSVSLTLPCIVGPFAPVASTLTLLKSTRPYHLTPAGGRNDKIHPPPRRRLTVFRRLRLLPVHRHLYRPERRGPP